MHNAVIGDIVVFHHIGFGNTPNQLVINPFYFKKVIKSGFY